MAALLSLLINKHGQKKGVVPFTSVELIQVVLKNIKNQKRQKMRGMVVFAQQKRRLQKIAEITENHSEFYGWANSCNIFVSIRS